MPRVIRFQNESPVRPKKTTMEDVVEAGTFEFPSSALPPAASSQMNPIVATGAKGSPPRPGSPMPEVVQVSQSAESVPLSNPPASPAHGTSAAASAASPDEAINFHMANSTTDVAGFARWEYDSEDEGGFIRPRRPQGIRKNAQRR